MERANFEQTSNSNLIKYEEREKAFQNRLKTFAIINNEHIDIIKFLEDAFQHFELQINKIIEIQTLVKVSTCFEAVFSKTNFAEDGTETTINETLYIYSENYVVDFETNLYEFYDDVIVTYILQRVDETMLQGSGFSLSEICELAVQVNSFQPFKGSSIIIH